MRTIQNRGLLRQLEGLFTVGTAGDLTDGQLLERFATRDGAGAEHAFSTLVERHGPMVLRVCQGVLANSHDTEDAFQATFLVLVKKARGLWVNDSLGPWLHQVALRTAACARSRAARRRKLERAAAAETKVMQTEDRDDLALVLHDEVNRLPDRFRLPLILCDMEGRTHEQVARQLGWPVGTVKSRLTRARDRLRDRLTRRGLAPTGVMITGVLHSAGLPALLPEGLVSSTTTAAIKLATAQLVLGGSAPIIAQGVLTAMSISRWIKVAAVLVAAGATVSGVGVLTGKGQGQAQRQGKPPTPVVEVVNPATLTVSTSGRGVLEVERSNEVRSKVEYQTKIISMVPDGSKIKKGDLVAELDAAALRNYLVDLKIKTKSAEANYQNAKLTREVAEIAVKEYEEGIYVQDRATVQGEIKLAESRRVKAQARLERTRRAQQKLAERLKKRGEDTAEIIAQLDIDDRIDSAEQALRSGVFTLEQAQSKLKVLEQYSKPKTLKELHSEVEKSRSTELAKQAMWTLERAKETNLERQINNCKLFAPVEGRIVHGDGFEEGSLVSQNDRVFWVFEPDSPIVVNVKVPESMVDRVSPGQKVRIDVDAFPNSVLGGVVTKVARLPDASAGFRGTTTPKVYSTLVKVNQNFGNFRPGMTAQAQILISERDHVLTMPMQAVALYDGQEHVAVKKPDGSFEWRVVRLGETNGSQVEVKEGLNPGEKIALTPIDLMSEQEKSQRFGNPPRVTPPAAAKPK